MRTLIALTIALTAGVASAQQQPSPCAAPERRQLDFWIGKWDVYPTGATKLVAHSLIEKLYGGCAVRENWMPLSGAGGGSLSSFDPGKGAWLQTWADSSGATVHFTGKWTGTAMVIEGYWPNVIAPGRGGVVRMSYSRNVDGTVRQHGEVSEDGGKSWKTSFDFTYKPAS